MDAVWLLCGARKNVGGKSTLVEEMRAASIYFWDEVMQIICDVGM